MNTVAELKDYQKDLLAKLKEADTQINEIQQDCDHDWVPDSVSSISYFYETCSKCGKGQVI